MLITECPLTLAKASCGEVYKLLKMTLLSEGGTHSLPSQLLEELNVLFVYKDVITNAESSCKKE